MGKNSIKIALTLSLAALIAWTILGTGASLAWFADTSTEVKNIFHFSSFDLSVSHKLSDGTYEEVDSQTKIFDDNAIYEPGYVQVVYLKIKNKGSRAFNFKTAVSVTDYTVATNYFGQSFNLKDYLKFGLVTADTEEELDNIVSTRAKANEVAVMDLNNYSTDVVALESGKTIYMALIVRMPEEVSNHANYRGDTIPKVELGIIVRADQQKTNEDSVVKIISCWGTSVYYGNLTEDDELYVFNGETVNITLDEREDQSSQITIDTTVTDTTNTSSPESTTNSSPEKNDPPEDTTMKSETTGEIETTTSPTETTSPESTTGPELEENNTPQEPISNSEITPSENVTTNSNEPISPEAVT